MTLKKLRDSAVFNEHKSFVSSNDTLRFLPGPNESLGYASFTPEFYSYLELNDIDGCAFITFANGKPYVHPVNSALFNEFYGIACDEMFAITINQEPKKVKRCLAIELKSGLRWFSKEITTDNPNFISEIPAVRWHLENKKWSANFLFNKNSRGGLYGNTKDVVPEDTRGRFINVLMNLIS